MSTVNKNLPDPLPLKKLIGPSFIILGVGLGSGELILWPYLSANFGLGIIWAAVLGITLQFFINMEIERYTLATGESIFAGLKRKYGFFMPYWFIATTLIPWIWPGIVASAATVLAKSIGIEYSGMIGVILLFAIGIIYGLGDIVYKTQETVQKAIILVGVPFVLLITFVFAKTKDWISLAEGLVGKGENYWFLPDALPWAIFLSALAFAGAGGNLNLAQSLYVKEKGYGMAANSGNITNVLKGKSASIKIEGEPFSQTTKNIKRFQIWWKRINIEHFVVFWATGAFTMIMLSLLAYSTVYGVSGVSAGISFVIKEAEQISKLANPALGTFFLVMVGVMLFGTQFNVYGSNARIASENLVLANQKLFKVKNISNYFYIFLWTQIIGGTIVFLLGFAEPLALVTISGILNAFAMFTYTGLILYMNKTVLPNSAKPNLFRTIAVSLAFLFYGAFSLFTIYRYFGHYIIK
ncbi:MAG: Nramp family divalent metal transporter [Patescibacteria group bacterium]|nr:Nramp family divalent metal transporter [Patescibacteria group bacterium]